ncbi:MAG: hypothetical protein ACI4L9_06870 [Candidatus Coproplasma sp.]
MKKFLTFIIALALVAVCAFAGCTEYIPPVSPAEKPDSSTDIPDDPNNPGTGTEVDDKNSFTVTLYYLGEKFIPENEIYAQWSDGTSIYRSKFGNDGVARSSELDGDYVVTLSALPEGYTYEPNNYRATNYERHTAITLYKINSFSNNNDGSYFYQDTIISLPSSGAYRLVFTKPDQILYFSYGPTSNGVYVFQSLIDVTANEVNPVLYRYIAPQINPENQTPTVFDGGGSENTYTKNFKCTIYLEGVGVGNDFKFGIRAESIKKEAFPIVIDFLVMRESEYLGDIIIAEPVEPTENFKQTPDYPDMTFKLAADYNNKIQNADLFKLNPEDGYYHLYDAQTDTYGAILYATITRYNEILGTNFLDPMVNYRLKFYGKSYITFIQKYADYVNSDGLYAVTEELKEFLQIYSIALGYFIDGNGVAEGSGLGYKSGEDDQWLWGCGYYS